MLSKITIEVEETGVPYLSIKFVPSDDVRDKLIERYLARFQKESSYAQFYIYRSNPDGSKQAVLNPLTISELSQCALHIQRLIESVPSLLVLDKAD